MDQTNNYTQNKGLSEGTKTLIVVLTLIFTYTVGLILMFLWMKWRWWIKLLISVLLFPVAILFLGIYSAVLLSAINPVAQIKKARCVKACQNFENKNNCV